MALWDEKEKTHCIIKIIYEDDNVDYIDVMPRGKIETIKEIFNGIKL